MPTKTPQRSGARARQRLERMRLAQTVALDLFEERGFDRVTIEEVAAACDVSTPTIYRHFGTKEQLVLWDEYDALVLEGLRERLRALAPLDALRQAILDPLDRIYASDSRRILRRARLAEAEPGVRAARASAMASFRSAVANALLDGRACRDRLEADVVAGAFFVALETAIAHWSRAGGRVPLRKFIDDALRDLASFGSRARKTPSRPRKKPR